MTIRLLGLTALAGLFPLAAIAQTPPPFPASRVLPITISVQTTMFVSGPMGTTEESNALHAKARAMLYKVGAGECALAMAAIPGDCKVSRITVTSRDSGRSVSGVSRPDPGGRTGVDVVGSFILSVVPSE